MIKLRHWLGFKLGLILTIQITFVYSGITIEQLTKFNSTWTDFTLSSTDNVRKATNSDNESWCEVYMLTVMNEYNEQTHQKTQGLTFLFFFKWFGRTIKSIFVIKYPCVYIDNKSKF